MLRCVVDRDDRLRTFFDGKYFFSIFVSLCSQENNSTMKLANLHCHSIFSDGDDTPEEVVRLASEAGVELLSLTDHNTLAGYERFEKACQEYGVNFVRGVEIDCLQPEIGFSQELLAYFPNGGEQCLDKVLEYKQAARRQGIVTALFRMSEHYGIELNFEEIAEQYFKDVGSNETISKHYIRQLIARLYPNITDYDEMKKSFWERSFSGERYTLYELLPIVREGGGFPVLAHFGIHFGTDPNRMRELETQYIEHLSDMKSLGLWGLELHPYHYDARRDEVNSIMTEWADTVGLRLTTGSDYHGADRSCYKIVERYEREFVGFE